jgi:hypothetical protein
MYPSSLNNSYIGSWSSPLGELVHLARQGLQQRGFDSRDGTVVKDYSTISQISADPLVLLRYTDDWVGIDPRKQRVLTSISLRMILPDSAEESC